MNDFDTTILLFLNKFSGQSWVFDHFAHDIQRQTLTGGVIMALFWGAWFWQGADKARIREHLTATCIGSFVALFVARILAVVLPFRERPLWNPELAFQPPYGSEQETPLSTWSSFPSDHAVLFFSLVTGLFFVSRFLGVVSVGYVLCVSSFPRIYVGLHYPTDIIAGTLIGIGIAVLVNIPSIRRWITQLPLKVLYKHPSLFYAGFFFLSLQISTLFGDVRAFVERLVELF